MRATDLINALLNLPKNATVTLGDGRILYTRYTQDGAVAGIYVLRVTEWHCPNHGGQQVMCVVHDQPYVCQECGMRLIEVVCDP